MATLTMEQDPDLKRFIEDRKQRYYDNDKAAVFATSLPLSNNGVEDRRSQLRDERHRDYQRYLERSPANSKQSSANSKQSSTKQAVYYRMDSPERGLPLGNYDIVKEKLSQERHQDYKNYLKKKHQDESERNRTRYSPSRPQAPSQPRPGDIDYSQMKQELADERKRDYQDYLKGKAEREFALKGRVPTPPGGLDIGQYEQERKALDAARKQEYRELLDKKERERQNPHQKVHTPPGGLLIGGDADRLRDMAEKKRQYRDELLKQQQEHMYVRAQQENGIPVLDRTPREDNSYVTSKPPPGPGANRQRDERESERYRPHADELPPPGPSDFPKGHHYSSDEYEKYRKELQQKQQAEYQDFLQKKNQQAPNRTWRDSGDNAQGLMLGDSKHENQKKLLNDERRREYNEHLAQKQMSDPPRFGRNTPPVVGPYSGIFAGLGQYDLDKQRLKKERQSEYSNYLDKTYAEKGRPYGRPTWAKGIDDSEQYPARPYSYEHQSNPETKPRDHLPPIEGQGQGDRRPPSYEDMLAKKRQMEADRRRFDPGFAPRDDRYEAERSGPPRDGDYAPRDGGYGGDGNQGQDRYRY